MYHQDLTDAVESCTRLGVRSIGLLKHRLEEFGVEKAGSLLKEKTLRVSSLSWAGGFTGSDGRSHEECLEEAAEAIQLAAAIRAPYLTILTGGRGGHTAAHAIRLAKSACQILNRLAKKERVTLLLEAMTNQAGSDWTFLNDLASAEQFLRDLRDDSHPIGLVFDTYQWLAPEFHPEEFASILPLIKLVRIGDRTGDVLFGQEREVVGRGDLAIGPFLTWLRAQGFAGPIELQIFGALVEDAGYDVAISESLKYIRRTFRKGRPVP